MTSCNISCVQEINRGLGLEQKELDLLAESEEGLIELSKDISLTTQQVKVSFVHTHFASS